jgi:hypothetical protein
VAAVAVEVLGRDQQVEDLMLTVGIHTMEELLTPIVVDKVATVLVTAVAAVPAVADQVDLLVVVSPDLINGMVVEAEEEETPTTDLT